MPADQQGQVYATGKGFGLRWYDEAGRRRRRSGFKSRSEAKTWFQEVERKRMRGETPAPTPTTLSEHVDRYLEAHAVGRDPKTIDVLRYRLGYATKVFGELRLDELERRADEIATWIVTLPQGSRHGIVQAFRQCCEAAVRWGLIRSNPAKAAGPNRLPKRTEAVPFEVDEVERLAAELGPVYGPLVIVGAYCGLRPSELIALEWRDVDLPGGVLTIERAFSYGHVKSPKTKGNRRSVPIPARAKAAFEQLPRRLDTRLVFPGRARRTYRRQELAARMAARLRVGRTLDATGDGSERTALPASLQPASHVYLVGARGRAGTARRFYGRRSDRRAGRNTLMFVYHRTRHSDAILGDGFRDVYRSSTRRLSKDEIDALEERLGR